MQADPELLLALFDMHRRTRSMRLRVSSVTDGTAEQAAKQAGIKARQTRLRMDLWNDEPDAPASSPPAPVDRRFIAELWVQRPDCVRREELCARDDEPRLAVYRAGSAWWWDRVRRGRELVGAAHPWMLGDELRLLLEPTTLLVGVELGGGPDRTVLGRRAGTI